MQLLNLRKGWDNDENLYPRESDEFTRDNENSLIRIVYCYQRLLDEDNILVFTAPFTPNISDLYAKHQLMDYALDNIHS